MNLLVIDIGNSNIVVGQCLDDRWKNIWRLPSHVEDPLPYFDWQLQNLFLEAGVRPDKLDMVLISSVVPDLTPVFKEVAIRLNAREPMIMGPDLFPALDLRIARPNEIGADLVCNALAVADRFQTHSIVVDFGTALTLTSVTADREILGVAIAPGVKTAMNALFKATAKLPEVPAVWPQSVIGKDTIHAIQSGVMRGYVGLIRHLVEETRKEMRSQAITIATGGLAHTMLDLKGYFDHEIPHLTLDGLVCAWKRINQ